MCTIEHPINELVRVGAITRLCTIEHAWGRSRACAPLSTRGGDHANELVRDHANELVRVGAADQYIIQANDPDRTGKDAYRSARNKYEKGELDKYKSACFCDLENPTNTLVSVLELCAMVSDITLH